MSEEITYIDEIAPITEEQWNRVITWGRLRYGHNAAHALTAAHDFSLSMLQLQRMAGRTQLDVGNLGHAIMKMAEQTEPGE